MYINKQTQNAIIEYSKLDSEHPERDVIYNRHIYPAFRKLAENIIHNRQLFNYGNSTFTDTVTDCVSFLTEQIPKFNPNRNSNVDVKKKASAFSFFNRCAINFLVANKQKIDKNIKQKVHNIHVIDNQRDVINEVYNAEVSDEITDFVHKWSIWGIEHLEDLFESKKEQAIAESIFNVFLNCRSLDIIEKKSLFIFIREQINVKTPKITTIIRKLKPLFYEMFLEYKKNGTKKWKYYADYLN